MLVLTTAITPPVRIKRCWLKNRKPAPAFKHNNTKVEVGVSLDLDDFGEEIRPRRNKPQFQVVVSVSFRGGGLFALKQILHSRLDWNVNVAMANVVAFRMVREIMQPCLSPS